MRALGDLRLELVGLRGNYCHMIGYAVRIFNPINKPDVEIDGYTLQIDTNAAQAANVNLNVANLRGFTTFKALADSTGHDEDPGWQLAGNPTAKQFTELNSTGYSKIKSGESRWLSTPIVTAVEATSELLATIKFSYRPKEQLPKEAAAIAFMNELAPSVLEGDITVTGNVDTVDVLAPGDANYDGYIGGEHFVADRNVCVYNFGAVCKRPNSALPGDVNGDNCVNIFDVNLVSANWGKTVPGDADGDGDVDGADLVAWQTHFPMSSGATLADGDFDRDGDVDGADFVVWQTNFPTSLAYVVADGNGDHVVNIFDVNLISANWGQGAGCAPPLTPPASPLVMPCPQNNCQ